MGNILRKWTVAQQENSQEDVSNDDVLALPGMSGTKSGNNLKIKYKEDNPVNPSQQDLSLPITTIASSEIQIEKAADTDKIQLDINDPVSLSRKVLIKEKLAKIFLQLKTQDENFIYIGLQKKRAMARWYPGLG